MRFDVGRDVFVGGSDDSLVVASVRPAKYAAMHGHHLDGYVVLGARSRSGGHGYGTASNRGGSMFCTSEEGNEQIIAVTTGERVIEERDMVWFLLIDGNIHDRQLMRSSTAARFLPVIGEGERRSLLADVPCLLMRVAKGRVKDRVEAMDSDDYHNMEMSEG